MFCLSGGTTSVLYLCFGQTVKAVDAQTLSTLRCWNFNHNILSAVSVKENLVHILLSNGDIFCLDIRDKAAEVSQHKKSRIALPSGATWKVLFCNQGGGDKNPAPIINLNRCLHLMLGPDNKIFSVQEMQPQGFSVQSLQKDNNSDGHAHSNNYAAPTCSKFYNDTWFHGLSDGRVIFYPKTFPPISLVKISERVSEIQLAPVSNSMLHLSILGTHGSLSLLVINQNGWTIVSQMHLHPRQFVHAAFVGSSLVALETSGQILVIGQETMARLCTNHHSTTDICGIAALKDQQVALISIHGHVLRLPLQTEPMLHTQQLSAADLLPVLGDMHSVISQAAIRQHLINQKLHEASILLHNDRLQYAASVQLSPHVKATSLLTKLQITPAKMQNTCRMLVELLPPSSPQLSVSFPTSADAALYLQKPFYFLQLHSWIVGANTLSSVGLVAPFSHQLPLPPSSILNVDIPACLLHPNKPPSQQQESSFTAVEMTLGPQLQHLFPAASSPLSDCLLPCVLQSLQHKADGSLAVKLQAKLGSPLSKWTAATAIASFRANLLDRILNKQQQPQQQKDGDTAWFALLSQVQPMYTLCLEQWETTATTHDDIGRVLFMRQVSQVVNQIHAIYCAMRSEKDPTLGRLSRGESN